MRSKTDFALKISAKWPMGFYREKEMVQPEYAIVKASCIDGRERIAEASLLSKMHLFDCIQRGLINGAEVQTLTNIMESKGLMSAEPMINFYRPTASGGGWTESCHRDLKTIKKNNLQLLLVLSARHNTCGSLKVGTHLTDPDIAVMMAIDFRKQELAMPPVFRTHLEVNSKSMVNEPMNIRALVAHAILYGTSEYLPESYNPFRAAEILGINQDEGELKDLAGQVKLTSKGILAFQP